MSKGAQDWVARTDILLQSISELSARIKLGFSKVYSYYDYVTASADNLLISLTGKGTVISIVAWIQDTAIINDDLHFSIADGEVLGDWPYSWHRTHDNMIIPGAITNVSMIDDVNFRYTWNLYKPISFESSILFYFTEAHGRTPLVRMDAIIGTF